MTELMHSFCIQALLGICYLILSSESGLSYVLVPKAQPRMTTSCQLQLHLLESSRDNCKSTLDGEHITYYLDETGRPADHHSNRELLSVPTRNNHNSTSTTSTGKMINLQTPHAGRKFRPTHPMTYKNSTIRSFINKIIFRNNRRFTEGWYYRLTLPQYNESFVFIFSIEDAGRYVQSSSMESLQKKRSKLSRLKRLFRGEKIKSPLTLACMQLLGPQDTYLVQSDDDDTKFWGWKYAQGLGCTFEWKHSNHTDVAAMYPEEWREEVRTGFQILPFHFQGRLSGHDGTMGGVKANQGIPGSAEYDFTVRPLAGWGNYLPLSAHVLSGSNTSATTYNDDRQFSTAGWLANYPVFEPHWQITMANARASGTLNWNGTKYAFEDAPFYGEKNWGKPK